ncbi:hypothetical protein LTR95_011538 [Oleoguttula sp. CCFEE 5521]
MATLDVLGPELLLAVVKFITRESDLRSVSLTCHYLQPHAYPALYRQVGVDLDIAVENDALLTVGHSGHGYFAGSDHSRDVTFWQHVLKSTSNLRELGFDSICPANTVPAAPLDAHLDGLFGDAGSELIERGLQMTHLSLRNMSFGSATHRLLQVVDVSQLTNLRLTAAHDSKIMLIALATCLDAHGTALKHLDLTTQDATHEKALTTILAACVGLQVIFIKAVGGSRSMPAVPSITRHLATLRAFAFIVRELDDNREWIIHECPPTLLDALVPQAPALEEVALHLGDAIVPWWTDRELEAG